MLYVDFYRKFGIRKLSELYSPKIMNIEELMLPKTSTLYMYDLDTYTTTPTKKGLLKRPDDIVVKTVKSYGNETIGNFRLKNEKYLEYIKKCKIVENKIHFLKDQSLVLKTNTVLVKNFLGLNEFYKYINNPMLPYWRFYNLFNTIIEEINKETNRNIFLPIYFNTDLKYVNFKILQDKKLTNGLIKRFPTYDLFIMFMLWDFINPDKRSQSLLYKLKIESIEKVNFIVTNNNQCSIINLKVLLSCIDDYKKMKVSQFKNDTTIEKDKDIEPFDYKISTIPYKMFSKLLYLMFKKVEMSDNLLDIKTIEITNNLVDNDKDLDHINDRDLDSDIDEYEANLEDFTPEEIENIEAEILSTEDLDTIDNEVKSLNDLLSNKDIDVVLKDKIETLKDSKYITKNKAESLTETLDNQKVLKLVVGDKKLTLEEIKNYKHNFDIPSTSELEPSLILKDKGYLSNKAIATREKYIKEDHEIMILKTIMSLEKDGNIINNITKTTNESILGKTDHYKIEVSSLNGNSFTLETILPKIEENGTYKLSNNNYILRNQRADLPIRKISYNEVVLSSYNGKLFISRGTNKNNDLGYWIKNQLLKEYNNGNVNNLVLKTGKIKPINGEVPDDYNVFARYIKFFKYNNFDINFNYDNRSSLIEGYDLDDIEDDGVVIGSQNGKPLIMRYDNEICLYDNEEFIVLGNLFELLNLDMSKSPIEYINIRIFKTQVPLVILLMSYSNGIENLLNILNTEFYYEKSNTRIDKNQYLEIKLAEDKLIIKRSYKTDILFNGLSVISNNFKYINRLNTKNDIDLLLNLLSYSLLVKNEIQNLNNMYIDPITLEILKQMKLPETFPGLLLKATEMLADDNYQNPNKITGMAIKGYERISGMLYKELSNSIRDYRNRSTFGRSKMTMNPYAIIKKLNEDSTTMLVNDINPIANLKQYEDVTLLGFNGLSKESVSRDKRQYDVDDIGILSEANKDSGDVGISAYLTANPNIVNTLGMVDTIDIKNKSWANILSTSAMLAPFCINDDMKRVVFSGIQNEHVIPTKNMRIPYVRTPYDILIASRLGDKYCHLAKGNGEVIKVNDKVITIKYEDGNKDYKLYSWYSKIESNSTFKHTIVSNVIKGEKVKKDDVIAYDNSFFVPDTYDKTRVVYLQSTLVRLAFIDDIDTYEDSTTLSYKLAELMSIETIKLKSIPIKASDNILEILNIGDKVVPVSTLLTITNQIIDLDGLDEDSIEVLKNMNSFSPKAKYTGTVDDIIIYYNCEKEDLSPTLRKLVDVSDKKLLESTGYTGRVDNSYSIKGVPLLEGNIEIRMFLKVNDDMSIADKMIWGNQLKCTVGGLYNKITTFDTNEEIDATFSSASVSKRITPSVIKMGVLSTIAETIENTAIDMYFK